MDTKVKCNNGTFVGKETDKLIIWKGIPYATQPEEEDHHHRGQGQGPEALPGTPYHQVQTILKGCDMLGMEVSAVAEICIEGMKPHAAEIGLLGTEGTNA